MFSFVWASTHTNREYIVCVKNVRKAMSKIGKIPCCHHQHHCYFLLLFHLRCGDETWRCSMFILNLMGDHDIQYNMFFFVFSSTGLFVRLLGSFSNFGCLFVGEKNLIPVWLIGADWWLLTAWKLDMLYELWAVAGAETAATDIGEHCLFFLFLSLAGWLSSTDFVSS